MGGDRSRKTACDRCRSAPSPAGHARQRATSDTAHLASTTCQPRLVRTAQALGEARGSESKTAPQLSNLSRSTGGFGLFHRVAAAAFGTSACRESWLRRGAAGGGCARGQKQGVDRGWRGRIQATVRLGSEVRHGRSSRPAFWRSRRHVRSSSRCGGRCVTEA